MSSWKTTLGGLIGAIGVWASQQSTPWWLWKLGALLNAVGLFLLGVSARDNGVPSSAVASAARTDALIKSTTPPSPPTTP
jgi:hypothetical protein